MEICHDNCRQTALNSAYLHNSDTFPITPWTLVAAAGAQSQTTMRLALEALLRRYLPALRAHLLAHRRLSPDGADELLQAFVSRKVLEQRLLTRTNRARGRFRSFLLTALNNFFIDELRKQKVRGVAAQLGDIEHEDLAAAEAPSPEFDRSWARAIVNDAVARTKWECDRAGRADLWTIFETRVLAPSLRDAPIESYDSLVARLKLESPSQASNLLMTAKRMFTRNLRGVLAESAEDEREIDQDLSDLRQILSENGGAVE